MQKIITFFTSTRAMALMFIVYILAMASATFIENDYGTPTAKRLVYNAIWFELLQFLLILNFIYNIRRYKLYRKEKWPILMFHLAFILLFIGGMVSRYIGYEGVMNIREGQTQNQILTDKNYLDLQIFDTKDVLTYKPIKTNFAYMPTWLNFLNTHFRAKYSFHGTPVELRVKDFVPRAKDTVTYTPNGTEVLHIVSTNENGRQNIYLPKGEMRNIGGLVVGFQIEYMIPNVVNISQSGNQLFIETPIPAQYQVMATQETGVTDANSKSPFNLRSLYQIANTQIVVPESPKKGQVSFYAGDKNKDQGLLDLVVFEIQSGNSSGLAHVFGGKNNTKKSLKQIDGVNYVIGYGAKTLQTDFAIKLDNFIMDKYPGSMSPSSYKSIIDIIDDGKSIRDSIYMNHVLNYEGYRFFQSSYDSDEKGTILSVNHDFWGTTITYLGYALLFLGLILTLFWKDSHFTGLFRKLKALNKNNLSVLILFFGIFFMEAQHSASSQNISIESRIDSLYFDPHYSDEFGKLQVQNQGRIEPMNTLALDLLRKLTKKEKFGKLDANQWMIAVNTMPNSFWIQVPMIKVGDKGGQKLKELTNANEEGYTRLVDLMKVDSQKNFQYVLEEAYEEAFRKKPSAQSNFDKEVIKLNERVYILDNLLARQYLNVIPKKFDPNSSWTSGMNISREITDSVANSMLNDYLGNAMLAIAQIKPWSNTEGSLTTIQDYQQKWGGEHLLPERKVDLEIFYNKANAFFKLMIYYSLLALILLVSGFVLLYYPKNTFFKLSEKIGILALFIGVIVHLVFLIIRWYISGHAPWSNGYEAVIFISLMALVAGFSLRKNSNAFIPMAGCLTAVMLMGFAHGGELLDPQITPLVPVLKSYWLMIHVAVITSSYGFFGMAALLGVLTLISYILTNSDNKKRVELASKEMILVIEIALTIGIVLLSIGTFLGGIWANESWGRYWSWDPKETWAYISIFVYAFVLHMRLVPGLRGAFLFVCLSIVAFSSVVMTYFGVNYYLSGLHSYAAGDPLPIPNWIYISIALVSLLIIFGYFRYKKYFKAQTET